MYMFTGSRLSLLCSDSAVVKSHHVVFVMNRVAEFCMRWSFCIWWRDIVFIGTGGKVSVGKRLVLYSFSLLCVVRFLIFL